MQDRVSFIFESYNMTVESGYNRVFENSSSEEMLRPDSEECQAYIAEEIEKWENTLLKEVDNMTPKEFFSGIHDIDEAIRIFEKGSIIAYEDLPRVFVDKLNSFGELAVKRLEDIALKSDRDEEYLFVRLMAVKVLGSWKNSNAIATLLKIIYECSEGDELLSEEIVGAFQNIGTPAVEPILNSLTNNSDNEFVSEQLIGALVRIGANYKSDDIFYCLKNSFRTMKNKMLLAMYLGDYGDGRAIPALRGYAKMNIGTIDVETYVAIKDAVRNLGGNMDDIRLQVDKMP